MRTARIAASTAAACLLMVGVAGCAADAKDVARDGCLDSVREQIGEAATDYDLSNVATTDMSEALFDLGGDTLQDDGRSWLTSGDFTYREDGATHRKNLVCLVVVEDGKPTEPIEATLT